MGGMLGEQQPGTFCGAHASGQRPAFMQAGFLTPLHPSVVEWALVQAHLSDSRAAKKTARWCRSPGARWDTVSRSSCVGGAEHAREGGQLRPTYP
jgi:hypothetical protein